MKFAERGAELSNPLSAADLDLDNPHPLRVQLLPSEQFLNSRFSVLLHLPYFYLTYSKSIIIALLFRLAAKNVVGVNALPKQK